MKMNKKGFTLAELLIVVAIIGVLTVVAVPIFTTQLEKSREETDIANMRSAKAAAVTYFMDNPTATTAYFDAFKGQIVDSTTGLTGYGKGTTQEGESTYPGYNDDEAYTDEYIIVTQTVATGEVTLAWSGSSHAS